MTLRGNIAVESYLYAWLHEDIVAIVFTRALWPHVLQSMGDKQSFNHGFQSLWSETLIKTKKIFLYVSMEILRDLYHVMEG